MSQVKQTVSITLTVILTLFVLLALLSFLIVGIKLVKTHDVQIQPDPQEQTTTP